MKRLLIALTLASCSMLAACVSSPAPTAEGNWNDTKRGLSAFTYKVSRPCFCPNEYVGPFLVKATPDSVVEVRRIAYPSDTVAVTSRVQSYAIDSLIAEAGRQLAKAHDYDTVHFHAVYGFPEHVFIDFSRQAVDEEYALSITDFEAVAK